MKSNIEVSVVLPAYCEEQGIEHAVTSIIEILGNSGKTFELIIVVDGDIDKTAEILQSINSPFALIEIFKDNKGKGAALEKGINLASGSSYIGFIDADLDIDPLAILNAIDLLDHNPTLDLVVGSKLHPDSIVNYPRFRRMQSNVFRRLVQILFRLETRDTQTGFKFGRTHVLKECLPAKQINGFAFDLNLLINASKKGYNVREIPIRLNYQFESSVRFRSAFRTLVDTLTLYLRQ